MTNYAVILCGIFILPLVLAERPVLNRLSADGSCGVQHTAYYVDDGVELQNARRSTLAANITERQCLQLCSSNRDAAGASAVCAFATFESQTSSCTLFASGKIVNGAGAVLTASSGRRTFEKFCLSDDLPADCAGRQFVRVSEYILKGYAQATATFATLAECAAHCVREREFQCKSAMYFYEEGECITNSESAITRPDDFQRPDDDDKVIFVHNGCIDHIQASNPDLTAGVEASDKRNAVIDVQASEDERPASVKQSDVIMSLTKKQEIYNDITTTTIAATTTAKLTVIDESDVSAPEMKQANNSNDVFNTKNVIVASRRLYGATQLDQSAIDSNGPESNNNRPDGGPEHAPSGHFVVEDIILPATVKDAIADKKENINSNDGKSISDAKAPGIPPPHSGFVFSAGAAAGANDDEASNIGPLTDIIHPTPKPIPHAMAPKLEITVETTTSTVMESSTPFTTTTTKSEREIISTAQLFTSEKVGEIIIKKSTSSSTDSTDVTVEPIAVPGSKDVAIEKKLAPTKKLQLKPLKSVDTTEEWIQFSRCCKTMAIFQELFSAWGDWTPCRLSGERRIRRRKCLDLRRCKGALMQVDYCTEKLPEQPQAQTSKASTTSLPISEGPTGPPVRNPLPIKIDETGAGGGLPPAILPNKLPEKSLKPLPAGAPGRPNKFWSPWIGGCQQFVSPQPCKNGKMIGFESRECIAQDPGNCKEPFFRYCTLSC